MPLSRGRFAVIITLLLSLSGCHGCWDDDDDDTPPVIPPLPPTNLIVTLATSGRVRICWTDNSGNETGFRIERSPDDLVWTPIATVPANTLCYTDRGLLPDTSYFYRVSATGNGGSAPTASVPALTGSLAWDAATVGGGPTARLEHSAIYDAANQRMIVYGGDDFIYEPTPDTTFNNDVWSLDLSTATPSWSALATTGTTAPYLANHSAIYDVSNKRMIVFGGNTLTGTGGGPENEVWSLTLPDDGVSTPTWSQLLPTPDPISGTPAPRFNHSAVYDSANLRMIVCGGTILGGTVVPETWALRLPAGGGTTSWTALSDAPQDLTNHSAIYDTTQLRMLVFGGADASSPTNAVYNLDLPVGGAAPTWSTLLAGTVSPPGARFDPAAVYESMNERMIVFGGGELTGTTNDTWVLPLIGPPAFTLGAPTGTLPTPRMSHTAVYDPLFERMIVFSGDDGTIFPIDDLAWSLGF